MQTGHDDWPTALESMWGSWAPKDASETTDVVGRLATGLVEVVGLLYRDEPEFDVEARKYVATALDHGRPAWSAAGRAVWALGLWRKGDEESALFQLVLAELELQEELRSGRPDPEGGPTGPSAASNNLGMAYSSMRMFELAVPHLQCAVRFSEELYGPELRLQVVVDRSNLTEVGVRWALHAESVGRPDEARQRARTVRLDAQQMIIGARQLHRPEAEDYARALLIGARSIEAIEQITDRDRSTLADIVSRPVFGDDPSEVVIRAIQARVCRLTGDRQGCRDAAARTAAMGYTGDHAMIAVALREAALLERPDEFTWGYTRAIVSQSEAARRRAVAAFRTRLALAGLEQRYEEVSADRQRLQRQLEQAARGEAELVHAATHDGLTGLPNRTLFLQRLDAVLQSCGEMTAGLAVAFIDLDNLKQVNDVHGHLTGDQVLQCVGSRLQASVRASDTVARLSGDEFAVLMVSQGVGEAVTRWANRINEDLNAAPAVPQVPTTVSVGVCLVVPGSTPSVEQVMRAADEQMYLAKREGKGRARISQLPG